TAMRNDPRWKQLPTIILTAAGQEAQHQRALELGASEFLTKPFSPKKLYQRAAELTGLASAGGAHDGAESRPDA
ncbi:MAG: response regulator, partial [Gemmatimonadaceae bacterium]